jgi:guanylate kinase
MRGGIVTITGASCTGKSTFERYLTEIYNFERVISTTTRSPRPGEKDGESYYFVTNEKFHQMYAAGEMVESAMFDGNLYGIQRNELTRRLDSGKDVVAVVEPKGMYQVRQWCESANVAAVTVFLIESALRRAERLTDRLKQELAENNPKAIANLTNRVTQMLGLEAEWVRDALERYDDGYDIVWGSTEQFGSKPLAEDIIKMLDVAKSIRRGK